MNPYDVDILVLASLVAMSCAIPGVFLVLRKVSLMSDAISHAILLGIVLAFFLTNSLSSPWLIIGAALTGLLTVSMTEGLINTRKLKEDAAIGLVFPLLFSLGVILLTKYAGDVHLDTQCVLFGEIAFTPFERLIVAGMDLGPKASWVMGAIFALNVLFVGIFYKELKITTFDPELAASLGFKPVLLNYALMTIVSITAVGSFESVGSILVVALMIVPAAAAYLLTDRLAHMILLSAAIGIASAAGGYFSARAFDVNIAGAIASFSGVLFFAALIFAPERGLWAKAVVRKFREYDFASETLAVHLLQAEQSHAEEAERVVHHMNEHMLWNNQLTSEAIAQALKDGVIRKDGERLSLTAYGREKAKNILEKG